MRLLRVCLISVMLTGCAWTGAEEGSPKRGFGLLGDFATPPMATPSHRSDRHTATMVGYSDVAADAPRSGPKAQSSDVAADATEGAPVTLNFDNAELQEFVRVVFDEVLKQNVIVDPALTGRVTLRTSHPVSRGDALKLVREVLRLHGATLVADAGVSKVVASGRQAPGNVDTRIVRLRYLEPAQARAALQPFTTSGVQVSANVAGRFLAMSGPTADIRSLEEVLGSLDIDQMRGRSIALIPLREATAASVAREIQTMFGPDSGHRFQAMPIDRMNAVLVMADQASTIARAKKWIAHLDQSDKDKARMFVYPVQNRRATELANVLNGMFATKVLENKEQAVAPSFTATKPDALSAPKPHDVGQQSQPYGDLTPQADSSPSARNVPDEVRIKADVATNSVVVYASPEDYAKIERAMRSLDLPPAQVLIEATIAEVTLNDALRYGVRWFFQNQHNSIGLISSDAGGAAAATPGFNYSFSIANAQVALNLLEQMTKVEVVSSPALTVLNNQTATLQVGDQVPITTQSSQGTAIAGAPVINSIQMKDTGIILNVTPRVNAGGMMVLDINQEVSSVVPTTTSNIDSPTIRQRRITSSVTIGNGMELVLGGLIQKETDLTKEGIPILNTIPVIGNAFTSKKNTTSARTELLILIRPTILTGKADWAAVTKEIKDRVGDASAAMRQ